MDDEELRVFGYRSKSKALAPDMMLPGPRQPRTAEEREALAKLLAEEARTKTGRQFDLPKKAE